MKKKILAKNLERKIVFMLIELGVTFALYKHSLEIATASLFLLVVILGTMFFQLIDEINNERL